MTRGEIWWVDFGLAYGSMPQDRRPAVIVQKVSKLSPSIMLNISAAISDLLAV